MREEHENVKHWGTRQTLGESEFDGKTHNRRVTWVKNETQKGKINTIGYNSCKETTTKGEKQTKEHENVKMLFCLVTNVIS